MELHYLTASVNLFLREPLVHSSSMTPPFGLTDVEIFEARTGRPEVFCDRSFEFFCLVT